MWDTVNKAIGKKIYKTSGENIMPCAPDARHEATGYVGQPDFGLPLFTFLLSGATFLPCGMEMITLCLYILNTYNLLLIFAGAHIES